MSKNVYCDSCRSFLHGELTTIEERELFVTFQHHHDFESFTKAMQLPCAICRLAWKHPDHPPPSALNWEPILGYYKFRDKIPVLWFFTGVPDLYFLHQSLRLAFEPMPDTGRDQVSAHLPSNTRSDSAIQFLLDNYQSCRTNHACSGSLLRETSFYPSRLLNVGIDEDSLITLCSSATFRDEDYVCLSHCWGDTRPSTLTAETHAALVHGISEEELPKTFQDAIFITRSLRIRYLWIDSLCIFQDNNDDWATESARMGHIYSRAACTIAATSSQNSEGGLFFDRDSSSLGPFYVEMKFSSKALWLEGSRAKGRLLGTYVCDVKHLADEYIDSAPLNLRAWVIQEKLLSRRIMHFSDSQLFWQCYECLTCEGHPGGLPFWARPPLDYEISNLKSKLLYVTQQETGPHTGPENAVPTQSLHAGTYLSWCALRLKYSKCNLTKASDKLVAIRGISQQLGQATGDELIGGLWRSRMVEELCWHTEYPTREIKKWRAPTWSWASSDAPIWPGPTIRGHGGHENRRIDAQLMALNVPTKLSGEIGDNSFIKIKCRLLRVSFTPAVTWIPHNGRLHGLLELLDRDVGPLTIWHNRRLDVQDDLTFYADRDILSSILGYVVIMQYCIHEERDDRHKTGSLEGTKEGSNGDEEIGNAYDPTTEGRDSLSALFVIPCDTKEENFERIGLIHAHGSRVVGAMLDARCVAEDRVITLV